MLNEINWPHDYLPGFTDNFASNEVIVRGINAAETFANLIDTSIWPTYYSNVADVEFDNTEGTKLAPDTRFRFKTFGFPIEAEITEFETPHDGQPGRLAWLGRGQRRAPPRSHPRLAHRGPLGGSRAHPDAGVAEGQASG